MGEAVGNAAVDSSCGDVDVAIVGAGCNGLAAAAMCAEAGFSVVVLDRGDIAAETSNHNSRLVHGGLRYLEHGEVGLVFESLRDREWMMRWVPDLVTPLRFTIPSYRGRGRSPVVVRAGLTAYDTLSAGKSMPSSRWLSRKRCEYEFPLIDHERLTGAVQYYEGQIRFPSRLFLELAFAARDHGASVRTYTEVLEVARVNDRYQLNVQGLHPGARETITARIVVNAAGPWADEVNARAGRMTSFLYRTKGTHLIVRSAERLDSAVYFEARQDGRPMFVLPYGPRLMIGSTDIYTDEPAEQVRTDRAEVEYLLGEAAAMFPRSEFSEDGVVASYVGVRPLARGRSGREGDVSRSHRLIRDAGLGDSWITVVGGKLTTFRSVGAEVLAFVQRMSGDGSLRRRFKQQRHGFVARSAREAGTRSFGLDAPAGLDERVAIAFDNEFAQTLEDVVSRRLMLDCYSPISDGDLEVVAASAARVTGWNEQERTAQILAYRARREVAAGEQIVPTRESDASERPRL